MVCIREGLGCRILLSGVSEGNQVQGVGVGGYVLRAPPSRFAVAAARDGGGGREMFGIWC